MKFKKNKQKKDKTPLPQKNTFCDKWGKEEQAHALETCSSSHELWVLDTAWSPAAGLHSFQEMETADVCFSDAHGVLALLLRFQISARRMGMGWVVAFLSRAISASPSPGLSYVTSSYGLPLQSWKVLFAKCSVCDLITCLSIWEAVRQWVNGDPWGFHIPMTSWGAH